MSLILNGTTGLSGVDGSSGAPALQGNDSNTGVSFGTDTVTINTGGTARVTTDASGNVGVGTASPNTALHVVSSNTQAKFEGSVQGNVIIQKVGTQGMSLYSNAAGVLAFYDNNSGIERMRIDSSGNLLVGTTSVSSNGKQTLFFTGGSSSSRGLITHSNSTAATAMVGFQNPNGLVGEIISTNSSTAYNTTSDYRLKENVAPMTGALEKVASLKPVTYTWKADGSNGQGFIAHELQEVVPDCVTGEKDAVDADGNPQYQGVDVSFLVATLTAAIQEQQALITQLQADVAALKGAA